MNQTTGKSKVLTRIITGLVLSAIGLASLLKGGYPLIILCLFLYSAISWEFFGMALKLPLKKQVMYVVISLFAPFSYLFFGFSGLFFGYVIFVMIVFAEAILMIETEQYKDSLKDFLPKMVMGIAYPCLPSSLLVVAAVKANNLWLIWLVVVVVMTDTSAYFGGKTFGKNKLAPNVSPNKTSEGFCFGLLGGVIGSLVSAYLLNLNQVVFILIGASIVVSCLAVIGDLAESMVKRCFDAKDSGNLLPGHGGILDRLDALLFALPIVFALGSSF